MVIPDLSVMVYLDFLPTITLVLQQILSSEAMVAFARIFIPMVMIGMKPMTMVMRGLLAQPYLRFKEKEVRYDWFQSVGVRASGYQHAVKYVGESS